MNIYYDEFINIDGNEIHNTAIINDNVKLGRGNRIGAYCVIGTSGKIRETDPETFKGEVIIGHDNDIGEMTIVSTPVKKDEKTVIGDDNFIMPRVSIGHNTRIGNNCEICTGALIGGYAVIKDRVKIKMGAIIRNRITLNSDVIIGMGSVVINDIKKGRVWGNPAK